MTQITTYYHGNVDAVTEITAINTLMKYVDRAKSEEVETTYRAEIKHGFMVILIADNLPCMHMYVTTETMKKILDLNLITYISKYDDTYDKQCAEMDGHPEYPTADGMWWWINRRWTHVETWDEMVAWTKKYREQIGEYNWANNPRMRPTTVSYGGGYEILAHGVEIEPHMYAGTCDTYVTDEVADRLVVEMGYGRMYSGEYELPYVDALMAKRAEYVAQHGGE
jgi:hypothetical protein